MKRKDPRRWLVCVVTGPAPFPGGFVPVEVVHYDLTLREACSAIDDHNQDVAGLVGRYVLEENQVTISTGRA